MDDNEKLNCTKIHDFLRVFDVRLQTDSLTHESWFPQTREYLRGPVPGILITQEPLYQEEFCTTTTQHKYQSSKLNNINLISYV
jgi:hypothetical protein